MSSKETPSYTGYIFVDGSSTVLGVGDEGGQEGFRGRVAAHYTAYSVRSIRRTPRPECATVSVFGTGMFDRAVGRYALTLAEDLALLGKKTPRGRISQIVAVLLMGDSLEEALYLNGGDRSQAVQDYVSTMDVVRAACERYTVGVIGVGMPVPDEGFTLHNGRQPSRRLRQITIGLSELHMTSWNVPTRFVSIDDITNPETDRAPDGAHINASGYDRVADTLIDLIDPLLGIDSR